MILICIRYFIFPLICIGFSCLEKVVHITPSEWQNWENMLIKQWEIAVLDDVKKADHMMEKTNGTQSSSGGLNELSEN